MKKIAWIGVGIMGKSMVRNLMKAGFDLHIYARTRAKVEEVIKDGAVFHDTIADCVKGCEAVVTMVGYPKDVEEVYFSPGAILEEAEHGALLIDMTTTSPALAEKLYAEGKERGYRVVDAPVTGGDTGAKNGTLSILVGGDKGDYETCMPLFRAMGTNINYQGGPGCGQHAKMANQIMI
ncbi:MAG: NAD(P)-dependent oxidoreductase, partial [Ruminiclostridium sp.]|nr:NAD(P)-dependent oxidoreductase [Ruminiclostridium sp.]